VNRCQFHWVTADSTRPVGVSALNSSSLGGPSPDLRAGDRRDAHPVEQVVLDHVVAGGHAHLEQLGDPALEPLDLRHGEVVERPLAPVAAHLAAGQLGAVVHQPLGLDLGLPAGAHHPRLDAPHDLAPLLRGRSRVEIT
jgi:hypothetical protein